MHLERARGIALRTVLATAVAAASVLAACGDGAAGRGTSADAELRVAATVYPLAEVAERIGGDRVRVDNLTPPGAEPHDIELSSEQVDDLLDAHAVLYLGRGFQPAVEEFVGRASGETLDVLEGTDLRGAGDGDPGNGDRSVDPHVWLDPLRMIAITERVESLFVRLDPDGGEGHRERSDAYRAEIRALHDEYTAGLDDCDRRLVITSHAAFGYLTDRYGLEQEPVSGLSPEGEPDPKRLAELADLARERGATTVFAETLASPRTAETLAREADLRVATLDPLESLSADDLEAGRDYLSVMRENLEALSEGLGCR